ncbi:hypothetical protein EZ313_06395 [Ramlibacter henchirensis]|uniref:Uncharacterized protein n=2 Tax=Ramlibacter henchirensis TaxID=204072 RepID=A0A4Z0C858_9BURK|nr:hypothetical protein EZ313_06395 [Ramlibacter henchirensis]
MDLPHMAQQDRNQPAAPQARFTFHAAEGRLYARNGDGKIIDLGKLARQPDGSWHYLLDGNKLAGGAPSPEAAMADAASRMGFLYLDGQFTAVADAREHHAPRLDDAPAIELAIDELQARERMEDARV